MLCTLCMDCLSLIIHTLHVCCLSMMLVLKFNKDCTAPPESAGCLWAKPRSCMMAVQLPVPLLLPTCVVTHGKDAIAHVLQLLCVNLLVLCRSASLGFAFFRFV